MAKLQSRSLHSTYLILFFRLPQTISLVPTIRGSTEIPGYGLWMEMIQNFFPFPLWKRFCNSGIIRINSGTTFLFVNLKFSESCYVIPEHFGISFLKFLESCYVIWLTFWKIVPEFSGTRFQKNVRDIEFAPYLAVVKVTTVNYHEI